MIILMYGWRIWTSPTVRDYKMRILEAVTEDLRFMWSIGNVMGCEQRKEMDGIKNTHFSHVVALYSSNKICSLGG